MIGHYQAWDAFMSMVVVVNSTTEAFSMNAKRLYVWPLNPRKFIAQAVERGSRQGIDIFSGPLSFPIWNPKTIPWARPTQWLPTMPQVEFPTASHFKDFQLKFCIIIVSINIIYVGDAIFIRLWYCDLHFTCWSNVLIHTTVVSYYHAANVF